MSRAKKRNDLVSDIITALVSMAVVGLASAAPCWSQSGVSLAANSGSSAHHMDAQTKANSFHEVLKKMAAGERPDPQLWNDFVAAQNDDLRTGPGVGEKVPDFTLPDQYGRQHSLHDLMGSDGLLLVFTRSADW